MTFLLTFVLHKTQNKVTSAFLCKNVAVTSTFLIGTFYLRMNMVILIYRSLLKEELEDKQLIPTIRVFYSSKSPYEPSKISLDNSVSNYILLEQ